MLLFPALLLALSAPGFAREVRFEKRVDSGELEKRIVAAGLTVNSISCVDQACVIDLPDAEKQDPLPIVQAYQYADPANLAASRRARLRQLADRWDAGAITAAEKDELLRLLLSEALRR